MFTEPLRRQHAPLRARQQAQPVIRKSRATTMVAAQAGIAFSGTSEMNAAAIMILSTSGSISLPKSVTKLIAPRDLAIDVIGDTGDDEQERAPPCAQTATRNSAR